VKEISIVKPRKAACVAGSARPSTTRLARGSEREERKREKESKKDGKRVREMEREGVDERKDSGGLLSRS